MIAPSKNPVTTPFGWVNGYPLNKGSYPGFGFAPGPNYGFHTGVDFGNGGQKNPEIYMPEDGVVTCIPWNGVSYDGNAIVFDGAGGRRHFLGHMREFKVKTGDFVKQGTLIGIMGDTGYAIGVHTHWGVRVNGQLVNGLQYVNESGGGSMQDDFDDGNAKTWVLYFVGNDANDNDITFARKFMDGKEGGIKAYLDQGIIHHPGFVPVFQLKSRIVELETQMRISAEEVKQRLEASGRTNIPQEEIDYYANAYNGRIQLYQNLVIFYEGQPDTPPADNQYTPVTKQLYEKKEQ